MKIPTAFADVTEGDIVRNTDWLAEHLKPYGFQYVVINDGCDRIPGRFGPKGHHWLEPWHKQNFPKGPKWIAGYIKSQGLRPGLWLVPNGCADAVKTHPEWHLRNRDGGFIRVYNTPALDARLWDAADKIRGAVFKAGGAGEAGEQEPGGMGYGG